MDIYLKQAVLHVIDRSFGDPIYSQVRLDLENINTREYLTNKIKKITSAQTKTGVIREDSVIGGLIKQLNTDFENTSSDIVRKWYEVYSQSEDAPSADIFIVMFEKDAQLYMAFLKINYHQQFTHMVGDEDGKVFNDLMIHQSILSGKTQKADEAFSVNVDNLAFELIEKKYNFSGEKIDYLSSKVIDSEPIASLEDSVKTVKKVAEKVGKKYELPKFEVTNQVKDAISTTIDNDGLIDTEAVAATVFKDNHVAQTEFHDQIVEKVSATRIPVSNDIQTIAKKKYGKQKLKLSNGIEMTIPLEVYQDPNLIEFINNPDGTISVSIKNVEEVISRL